MTVIYQFKVWSHHAVDGFVRDYQMSTIQTNATTCSQTEKDGIPDTSVIHQLNYFMKQNPN